MSKFLLAILFSVFIFAPMPSHAQQISQVFLVLSSNGMTNREVIKAHAKVGKI